MTNENTCIRCEDHPAAEGNSQLHCPSCHKEHLKLEARLEARVERLHELIDHLRSEVDCFVRDFNDLLDYDERPKMLLDVAKFEARLRASGKALTHFNADWIEGEDNE